DNGYKLYLGDGAQIVPPVDLEIEALIEQVGPLSDVQLGDLSGAFVVHHDDEVSEAYLRSVVAAAPVGHAPEEPLSVVYTPMHGVAGDLFCEAVRLAGHPQPCVVAAQAAPDPDFPTVAFPNPEEPGALDLAFAEATRLGADLVLATDPDGDRLAVAVPDGAAASGWRRLTGDEVGVLLGAFVLERVREGWCPFGQTGAGGARPLVASSIVSSSMLAKIAASAGVPFVATLTGFKWIVRAVDAVPGTRLVFGYEEALGYAVGDVVHDKDGIGAGLAILALAGELRARASTLSEQLGSLMCRHGVHRTAQLSIPIGDQEGQMACLRASPPTEIAGHEVLRTLDLAAGSVWEEGLPALPPADVLGFWLDAGARVLVRPSGTEPKLKSYVEVVRPVVGDDLAGAMAAASKELDVVVAALGVLLGG
ncbi:MAG: phospho-sugar mutase, partial [Acidimicrobiales bacterium]